ncbi:MAG: dTDP-4-dehydrorhamnose reductase [Vibrio sp.]
MKILVTGANGQVGHCLTEQLTKFDDIETLSLDVQGLDITDESAVNEVVQSFQPDIIINAAAHTAVDKAETDIENAYAINEKGAGYLALAADKISATIFHISTDYVFSGDKVGEYTEEDPTNPQSIYGASKLAGEIAVQKGNPKHIILRTAWVFGEVGNNFIKTMLRLGKERTELSIVGDQLGGPTYAGDIAEALISIALKLKDNQSVQYGLYHFSGLPHVSWFEFAQEIFTTAQEKGVLVSTPILSSIKTEQYPTPAKRPANSTLSTCKITNTFGIKASDWKLALNNIKAYQ